MCLFSCKKDPYNPEAEKNYSLTFKIPRHDLKHDSYYTLFHDEHSIEIVFNKDIDENSVAGNVSFSDNTGILNSFIDIITNGNTILIGLHQDFILKDGWKYELSFSDGFKSVNGDQLPPNTIIEFRTLSRPIHEFLPGTGHNAIPTQRFLIACISDIHMGDERATDNKYCWFGKNKDALENFLDFVIQDSIVKELVIMGDLFDEWLVPYSISPFDPSIGITNDLTYFLEVAKSNVNKDIVGKLRSIATNIDIDLKYIPGNHDMLLTKNILDSIIPGIHWMGGAKGLGKYEPVSGIVLEHGHRYDFFNCPQPLVNQGQILPPGYFVSRLYAQGNMENANPIKGEYYTTASAEFRIAWDIAYWYTIFHFMMTPPDINAKNILMAGIDGYSDPMSFKGTEDMYAASIEDYWPSTQTTNGVKVPGPCCLMAIWNGHSDMYGAATREYMESPPAPVQYKIVAFGHTHEPMLKVYTENDYHGIYSNSGSWIDDDQSSYDVRTFLMINPGEWSGSDLDVVTLYQYDKNTGPGPKFIPDRKAEESVRK